MWKIGVKKSREGKEGTRRKEEKGKGNKKDKRAGSKKSGKEKEKREGRRREMRPNGEEWDELQKNGGRREKEKKHSGSERG